MWTFTKIRQDGKVAGLNPTFSQIVISVLVWNQMCVQSGMGITILVTYEFWSEKLN